MEEKQEKEVFKCTGDCLNCRKEKVERYKQWQYCSAQRSYDAMRMVQDMQRSLAAMAGTVAEMKAKIEAIQDAEATIYNPTDDDKGEAVKEAPAPPAAPTPQTGVTILGKPIAQ